MVGRRVKSKMELFYDLEVKVKYSYQNLGREGGECMENKISSLTTLLVLT